MKCSTTQSNIFHYYIPTYFGHALHSSLKINSPLKYTSEIAQNSQCNYYMFSFATFNSNLDKTILKTRKIENFASTA